MPLDPKQICIDAAKIIIEATRDLGSKKTNEPDLVDLGWGDLSARPVVLQLQEPPGGVFVALGVEVSGGELSRPMRDVAVGAGPNPEAAIKAALQVWLNGPYAVLHDALSDLAAPYRYGITQTNNQTGESTQWSIFESRILISGDESGRDPLVQRVGAKPLFVQLAEANALPPLDPKHVHWLKLHAGKDKGQPPMQECIFDSAQWKPGQDLLAKFEWPPIDVPLEFRQYWVFTVN